MKTATLHPAEAPGESITVIVSPVPVDTLFALVEQAGKLPRTRKAFDTLASAFLPFVESWSYDLPLTPAGYAKLDFNLAIALVHGWAKEVATAPLPLLVSSSDGTPSGEPSPSP